MRKLGMDNLIHIAFFSSNNTIIKTSFNQRIAALHFKEQTKRSKHSNRAVSTKFRSDLNIFVTWLAQTKCDQEDPINPNWFQVCYVCNIKKNKLKFHT